jgi:hypothetical protein
MNVPVLSDSCRMKSPVVPFCDPATATKQRAKFSLEGSYILILINISIITNNLPSDHKTNPERREQRKSWRALKTGLEKKTGSLSAFQFTGPDHDSSIDRKDKDLTIHNPG